jgi:hypothetical protein
LHKDKAATAQVTYILHAIHSFHFDKADSALQRVNGKWRNHPSMLLVESLRDYYRYLPISLHPIEYERYKKTVEKAAALADAQQEKNSEDAEAIFFSMMAYSILSRQASEDEENMKAVQHARKAFVNLKRGFGLESKFADFHFSNGLYNYYRVRFPEDHPVYKPFLVFFQDGDKAAGLRDLESAADQGLFSNTDALYFLAGINLHYECNPAKGLQFAQRLVQTYPTNPMFRLYLCEALLLNKQPNDVPTHVAYVNRFPSPFLRAGASAMQGLYHEQAGDRTKANAYFTDGLARSARIGKMIDNTRSICLAGQARVTAAQGERHKAKVLYRKVLDVSNNTYLRDEAHRYLRRLDEEGNKVPRSEYKKKAADRGR